MQATYLTSAETAKLIRAALKRSFPTTKFSVRCSRGSAIYVEYTDGPALALVKPVADQFRGGHFDGSIDMRIGHTSWLLPDGTATVASNPGTEGSGGYIPAHREWMPSPDAKLVHFGADFVFVQRRMSEAFANRVLAKIADRFGDTGLGVAIYSDGASFTGDYQWTSRAYETATRFMIVKG
jgi:hypothetical protein